VYALRLLRAIQRGFMRVAQVWRLRVDLCAGLGLVCWLLDYCAKDGVPSFRTIMQILAYRAELGYVLTLCHTPPALMAEYRKSGSRYAAQRVLARWRAGGSLRCRGA
jgi:hypothetical protein